MKPKPPHTPVWLLKIFLLTSTFYLLSFNSPLSPFHSCSFALDEGGATTSIEHRSINQETSASKFDEFETIYHLDIWQDLPNIGKLILWLDWANAGNTVEFNRLGMGYLTLQGFRFNDFILNGLVGDSSIRFTNLPEKFSNSSYADIYFRGFQTDLFSKWGGTYIFGGKVARLEGLLGGIYDTTNESFYGFKGNFRPFPWLFLGGGLIRTQNEVDSTDRPVTKNNLIYLIDSELEMFKSMKWLTEFGQSDFQGEPGIESQKDYALKFGPLLKTENLRLEANYRRIGTDYHFVNDLTQSEKDQEGIFLLAEYRPWKELTLFGNADRFHDNVSEKSDRNITDTQRGLIGLSFFSPDYPSLSVSFDTTDQKTRLTLPSPVDNLTSSFISELQYQYQNFNPYVRYRRLDYKDKVTPTNENTEDVITLGVRKNIKQGLMTYIEGELDRKQFQQGEMESRVSGKMGLNYFYSPKLAYWGEVIFSNLKEREEDTRKNRVEGSIGLSYQLPKDIYLYGDFRYNTILNPQTDQLQSKGFSATLRIEKKFSWGGGGKIVGLKQGIESTGYGSIEGIVFNDINRNGLQDKGEEGVKGVTVHLEDGSIVKTDEKGFFQFPRVETGSHLITLEAKKIPAEYSIISPERMKIEVKLRETVKINFQLIKSGRIEGRIINDLNANGKFDSNEKGIPDVLVLLEPGDNNTYTDEDGKFVFENILPGEYTLKLDHGTLPEGATFTSPSDFKLRLSAGDDVREVNFLIHVKPRPVIIGPPKNLIKQR